MQWLTDLRTLLPRQKPHVMALATIDQTGHPRVRNVVCRQIQNDGSLLFTSDARSDKNAQIRATPRAEAAIWLESARQQFRLLGSTEIVNQESTTRDEIWRELSDSARALFLWPAPGQPRLDPADSFARSAFATIPIPPNFEVILLRPTAVEHLDLSTHPHRRRRWTAAANWTLEDLNP